MIEGGYFWICMLTMAAGTFAIRGSIIAISGRVEIPARVQRLFSFIPAAILPAFVAPAVFFHEGHLAWAAGKERLLILVFASVVSYTTRSTFATIVFGLVALYVLAA